MSSSGESDTPMENRRRKKGVRHPELYRKTITKKARLSGKEYTNRAGKLVPAKATGPDCRCKMKCFELLTKEDQQDILSKLKDIESKDSQDIYLQSLLEVHQIKRRRARTEDAKLRAVSCSYFVLCGSERKAVCQKAFLSLHAISEKRLRRLRNLLQLGKTPKDNRGHASRPNFEIPAHEIKWLDEHITSFPIYKSHYLSREQTYLDARLNVKLMHEMFRTKFPESRVKYEYYLRYFHENYGYRFGHPQVDTCITCEELGVKICSKTLNDAAKRVASAELLVHKSRAKKFYKKMKQIEDLCKENANIKALCFDYMQNLPLPKIPVQDIFYLRQLWVFVFCIHELNTNLSKMCIYHEGVARKGANDVCSMLLSYINDMPENVKELHLFSDGCTGQNKNHTIVRLLLTLTSQKRFHKIYHYYPERGHSYLPCDRDFAVIKKKVRKADRVYTPQEYQQLVLSARKLPFEVTMVSSEDMFDIASWWPKYYKKSCVSLEQQRPGQKRDPSDSFSVTSNKIYVYDSDNPGVVRAYERIDGLLFRSYRLQKTASIPKHLDFLKAYPDKVPINEKKITDVSKVLQYIPDTHRPFYDTIVSWQTTNNEDIEGQ